MHQFTFNFTFIHSEVLVQNNTLISGVSGRQNVPKLETCEYFSKALYVKVVTFLCFFWPDKLQKLQESLISNKTDNKQLGKYLLTQLSTLKTTVATEFPECIQIIQFLI